MRPPQSGFVQVGFWEVGNSSQGLPISAGGQIDGPEGNSALSCASSVTPGAEVSELLKQMRSPGK
jgi:hypothetical protein